jgi:hypothetical protein
MSPPPIIAPDDLIILYLGFRHVNTQNRTNLRCTYIRYTERYSVCVYKIGAILGLFYYADELLWDGYFKLF